jgi:uncharacterized protein YukE
MNKTSILEEKKAGLEAMVSDLKLQKKAVEDFMNDIKDSKPEDISTDNEMPDEMGKGKEKEDHPVEIKTPEDAKKVLDEAKEDLQQVVDAIDGVMGQGEEESEKVASKRYNDKYAASLSNLSISAGKAIDDAKDALEHWTKVFAGRIKEKEAKLDTSAITHPQLKQAAETLQQVGAFEKILNKLGFVRKEATAVPPTGAEFSGDKWPKNGDPKEVETRQWEAGSKEHSKNKKKEDSMPNPAVDNRLNDEGNPRGDGTPYVESSYNDLTRCWDIYDDRTKKAIRYSFANAPKELGLKTEAGLKGFSRKGYGEQIAEAIIEDGIEHVRKLGNSIYISPKEAKKDNKNSVRKYYTDAFGDATYAKELTSGKNPEDMDIAYKPKDDKVKDNDFKTKDGPGKLSSQDKALLDAKALRGVNIARLAAAANVIPFTKTAVKTYAKSLLDKSDETIAALEDTFKNMELINEAALDTNATIPDSDSGIVGNALTGVTDPKGKSDTEGLDTNVEKDGKIAKKAGIVPQFQTAQSNGLQISDKFSTTANKFKQMGINPRLRIARHIGE